MENQGKEGEIREAEVSASTEAIVASIMDEISNAIVNTATELSSALEQITSVTLPGQGSGSGASDTDGDQEISMILGDLLERAAEARDDILNNNKRGLVKKEMAPKEQEFKLAASDRLFPVVFSVVYVIATAILLIYFGDYVI